MKIIISHVNTDFDALASMLAAQKLYPDAQVVISDKQNIPVRQFLNIYRDTLDLVKDHLIEWENVTELILVDVASLSRIGDHAQKINKEHVKITVFDHHPPSKNDVRRDAGFIEAVGATVTLLMEQMQQRSLPITPFEATLFGLGIYTDTGTFTFTNTTARDLQAASYLMEQGMNLEIVGRFSNEILLPEQQEILNQLFQQSTIHYVDGLEIAVSSYEQTKFQKGLATLTQKLLQITGADAVISVVGMAKRVYVVGRTSSERANLLPLLNKYQGGGHAQAGSATVKDKDQATIVKEVVANLDLIARPAITARDMMTSPVKTIFPETSIEESGQLMYRYGHSGFPVVKDDKLLGMITRRDLEKANFHGLGHAPVKAYMSTNIISIPPDMTEEQIQQMIIEHDIGRLPVVEDDKLIGIVSRTNVIQALHHYKVISDEQNQLKNNIQPEMEKQLSEELYKLLESISETAYMEDVSVYLIGGIVRDIFLKEPNDDIDIVVEGDGVSFAKRLQEDYGGDVVIHENFGTATWTHPTGLEIDVTTSRLEFYDKPAALPDVEVSTLKEDLHRRDFTINAMAIYLNKDSFGELIDPFRGQIDLKEKRIKILHNLSFVEDPTRILRGVRFETRFAFAMDNQTEKLALESIGRVRDLSVNRMVGEMKRMFKEDDPARAIRRLFELRFWEQFGVSGDSQEPSYTHAKRLRTLLEEYASKRTSYWFSYFVIPFFYAGNMDVVQSFALTRKEVKFLKEVNSLQAVDKWQLNENIGDLHRSLKDYSDEVLMFFLAEKDIRLTVTAVQYIQKRKDIPVYVTGKDLIEEGLKPSAYFSQLLLNLDVAVLNEQIMSKEEAQQWLHLQLRETD